MENCVISHPLLGNVIVTIRKNMVNITARWRRGEVHVSAPEYIGREALNGTLDRIAPRLLSRRPDVEFHDGMIMKLDGLEILFRSQSLTPQEVILQPGLPQSIVCVGNDVDWNNVALLSQAAAGIAHSVAGRILLPRARELAAGVGAVPAGWRISGGARTLGTCHANGLISLSSRLVFLPSRLRDYVIFHELAHLQEMNHSAGFHRLCNMYCSGHEATLRRELRNFRWPIIR